MIIIYNNNNNIILAPIVNLLSLPEHCREQTA